MLTIKREIIMNSYISIVPYRIEQEVFMGLNIKLEVLNISLNFWVRLVLDFVHEIHHAPDWSPTLPPIEEIADSRATIIAS